MGWVRWGERCGAVTEAGGVQHHLWLFFSAVFLWGHLLREVNAVWYVMCECLRNRDVSEEGEQKRGGEKKKKNQPEL